MGRLQNATLANVESLERIFWRLTMLPVRCDLTKVDVLTEQEEPRLKRETAYMDRGAITINEVRDARGLPRVAWATTPTDHPSESTQRPNPATKPRRPHKEMEATTDGDASAPVEGLRSSRGASGPNRAADIIRPGGQMQSELGRRSFIERMIGAALLRSDVYEEVEADTSATGAAALVVVLASLAAGVGGFATGGISGLVAGVIIGLLGWAIWAAITFFIGTRLLPTRKTEANWGQLARTLGFARAPVVLLALTGVIPAIDGEIILIVAIWSLVTMVVAVRQALDYASTGRAALVVAVGFIPYAVFAVIIVSVTASIFGAEALGIPTEGAEGA